MNKGFKRGLALALCAGLSFSMLAGCSKKEETAVTNEAVVTVNGNSIDGKTANFLIRFNQAQYENQMGWIYQMYYGVTDIWSMDMYGDGTPFSETFKTQMQSEMENLVLAQEHAADLGIELTEDEKAEITKAAAEFIASNDQTLLDKMSADQETVEKALTLYTLQAKYEAEIVKDVDTNVSDEEAAQRTVSFVNYTATTEADTEALTEGESEFVTETMTASEEPETLVGEAEMTEVEEVKTGAAEETETEAVETVDENVEIATETATEETTEAETETDSPEMAAAKAECLAMAEAFLATAQAADSWEDAVTAETDANEKAYASSFTFGAGDGTVPEAVDEATTGLEDGAIVDHVVQAGNTFYVIHVDAALDREATDAQKEQIVEQRKSDKISENYETLLGEEEATIDADFFANLLFNFSMTEETEATTESDELMSEEILEEGTEFVTEFVTEAVTEAASEGTEDAKAE